jgi:hypothetical protein
LLKALPGAAATLKSFVELNFTGRTVVIVGAVERFLIRLFLALDSIFPQLRYYLLAMPLIAIIVDIIVRIDGEVVQLITVKKCKNSLIVLEP